MRSIVFTLCFYLNTFLHVVVCVPVLVMPGRRALWAAVNSWANVNHWLLRALGGITYEIEHLDRIPDGPLLVACKHQSTWETYTLIQLFKDPVYVFKHELLWVPLFGWYCAKASMIPVKRGTRSAALSDMLELAHKKVADGRQILIFPEGTRSAPDAEPAYKYGIIQLNAQLGVPCLPIALNAGLYWPRRNLRFRPGKIRMEILEPIPPGLSEDEFRMRLESAIETATGRLVRQARAEVESRTA
jgi:1-acyl-sn-glycerol-3-phosphate acyltransferase